MDTLVYILHSFYLLHTCTGSRGRIDLTSTRKRIVLFPLQIGNLIQHILSLASFALPKLSLLRSTCPHQIAKLPGKSRQRISTSSRSFKVHRFFLPPKLIFLSWNDDKESKYLTCEYLAQMQVSPFSKIIYFSA